MNILVICQYFYPEQFRINDICEELVKREHDVTVLTGLPNYPEGKIPPEYRLFKRRKENINGVQVIRCWEIGRGQRIFRLALNYLSFMLSASLKAIFLNRRFDVIYGYQLSPITMMIPGLIYKKVYKKPFLIYCCDIWPESVKSNLKNDIGFIYKIAKFISKQVYKSADLISVSSKPFIEYLYTVNGIDKNKMNYNPQHAEDTYLNNVFIPINNDCVDFLFAGNVGIVQDIDCIINACDINRNIKHYKVHIVGDGSYLEVSKRLVKENNLEDIIIFHGRHPINKMLDFYQFADACLLTLKADDMTGLTMPSKLQGYMAVGKPVIGAINGSARDVILESKCGVCVNASDPVALAEAMKDFIINPEKYKNCGENGRAYFKQHFTKDIFIKNLEKTLYELVEG